MGINNKNRQNRRPPIIFIGTFVSALITLGIVIVGIIYCKVKMNAIGLENIEQYTQYNKHYAFIMEDGDNPFWDNVYKGAKEKGEQLNTYVERFGWELPIKYTAKELLKIAIAANVDGIIMQGDSDIETQLLINEAKDLGIPVATVLEDSPKSDRICFVGVNNYQLGKEYGNQVLEIADDQTQKVMVLLDANTNDASPNLILSGINDTLVDSKMAVSVRTIDRKSAFSSEEVIHDIMLDSENVPDIFICLDLIDTICVYQTIVDYNKVGKVKMIGYYNSQNITQAIKKEIIHSTIVIDTQGMGAYAVEALYEYDNIKRVSEYIPVDMKLISRKDIGEE
ncbi:MAG TPA: sugar ABC transporter substrate-binding protein [Epulopiscium sp.]|nr:sugar ABC transporter substrate-binding protein [Candidatus Epulonipiscium sp.]